MATQQTKASFNSKSHSLNPSTPSIPLIPLPSLLLHQYTNSLQQHQLLLFNFLKLASSFRMATSRGLVLFCLGTLWVSLLLIKVTEAEHSEYVDIHSVKHEGGSEGCKNADPNKGNQCNDDEDGIDVDDDFDDTYKVVNKVKVSLSGLGISAGKMTFGDDFEDSDTEDLEHNDRVIVLGH